MTKITLVLVAILLSASVFAQGFYNFNQSLTSALVSTNLGVSSQFVIGSDGGGTSGLISPIGSGGLSATFYFAVLIQPYNGTITTDTNVWDGTWRFSGIYATNRSNLSAGTLVGQANVLAPYWPAGVTNQYIIAGWSANLGSTWAEVSNTMVTAEAAGGFAYLVSTGIFEPIYFGVSSVGDVMLSSSGFGNNLFGAANATGNPINSPFTLYDLPLTITNPTPEPSTIALIGLSGLLLRLFRHRR